jgi:hypothetical protein
VPLWPADHDLRTENGTVTIEDSDGRTLAQVGKEVSRGGEVGLQKDMVDGRTVRELRSRCPGVYRVAFMPSVGYPPEPAPIPGPRVYRKPKQPS